MNQIQELHQQAMDLAEMAQISRLRNDSISATQLFRQAFEKEQLAAKLIVHDLTAEPTRSVLHRSAASLAMDCGDTHEVRKANYISFIRKPTPRNC
jgi:hypothetical protein